jgi:hypothetical protein
VGVGEPVGTIEGVGRGVSVGRGVGDWVAVAVTVALNGDIGVTPIQPADIRLVANKILKKIKGEIPLIFRFMTELPVLKHT